MHYDQDLALVLDFFLSSQLKTFDHFLKVTAQKRSIEANKFRHSHLDQSGGGGREETWVHGPVTSHWLFRSFHPGGNTQICSCSSPARPLYLHSRAIVRDTGDCTLHSKVCRVATYTHIHAHTPRESQSAWLGQLSCEVSCADWTYADPF